MSGDKDQVFISAPALPDFRTLHEVVKRAKQNLARNSWDYMIGGSDTETSLRRNRASLDAVAFKPRVLRNVAEIDMTRTFLGHRLRLPILLAPIGSLESFSPNGGADAAVAAAEFGVMHLLSSTCLPEMEEVAEAAPDALRVYNLYVRGDAKFIDDRVKRAVDCGNVAFSITVDSPMYSRRERDLIKRYVTPGRQRASGPEFQAGFNWDDVKRFKDTHDLPLFLKGIQCAEDAALAIEHGADVVYVTNHGGRQLDHGRGSFADLRDVASEVKGRVPLVMDGGIMRATDMIKAIAAGADAVGIGRLQCIGLAAGGPDGVAGLVRTLELLETECRIAMANLGARSWDEVGPEHLVDAQPVRPPHALSAFPHLEEEGY